MRLASRVASLAVAVALTAALCESATAAPAVDLAVGGVVHDSARSAAEGSSAHFHMVRRPSPTYLEAACFTDLSTVPDGTPVDLLVNDCGFQISLSTTTVKESVPATWQRWGRPPRVESARPDVLSTDGASTLTLSWGSENTVGGVEVQPRRAGREAFQADFYSGPNGTGTVVGAVVRQRVDAPGGARLLAARSSVPWQSIVISDLAGREFAVAEIRGA